MLCTQQWLQESLNSAIQRSPQWRTQLELKKVKREVKHTENPRLLRNILKMVSPEMSPISSHCQLGIVALAGELRHPTFSTGMPPTRITTTPHPQPGTRPGFVASKNSGGWRSQWVCGRPQFKSDGGCTGTELQTPSQLLGDIH